MITWLELQKFSFENPPKFQLKRSTQVQKDYDIYISTIKSNNNDINKIITQKYFSNNKNYVFVPNLFPYDIEDGIKHYLIWFNPILNNIIDKKYIEDILISNLGNKKYIYFINFATNKSVKNVEHCQVFLKEN